MSFSLSGPELRQAQRWFSPIGKTTASDRPSSHSLRLDRPATPRQRQAVRLIDAEGGMQLATYRNHALLGQKAGHGEG